MANDLPILSINTLITDLNTETKKILDTKNCNLSPEDVYVENSYNIEKKLEKTIINSPWNLGGKTPVVKILKCPYFSYNVSEDILIIDINAITIFLPLASEYPSCTVKIVNQQQNSENCFRTKINNIENINCIIENNKTDKIVDTEEIVIFTVKNSFYHILSNNNVWQFVTTLGINVASTAQRPGFCTGPV